MKQIKTGLEMLQNGRTLPQVANGMRMRLNVTLELFTGYYDIFEL